MNLLIICCFTITILGISVQATPDCPEGQHRCANGECHDCCYDSHCGETCGCTICADYQCMPLCSPVEGWHCCLDSEGEPNCKRCCSDSDCPFGEECTMFGCTKSEKGDNLPISCPLGLHFCGQDVGCKPCCDKSHCQEKETCRNYQCVSWISKF